ncbi:MAG: serine/threonine-protein kinase [Bacteroidales bacterium]
MDVSDAVVDHLRRVAGLPDLAGTRYVLDGEIGRGGLGVVYAARDRDLDRRVALKVLDEALAGEARLIARLEHPAIVPIYESGTLPDGRVFYAMKLIEGVCLDEYLERQPTRAERLRLVRRVGEAVAFAHAHGVLHRDLKPRNVMVGAFGEVYVMDWGIEGVVGTPPFRAPDGRFDERSDVYSLGALLAFALGDAAPPPLRAVSGKAMEVDPSRRYGDVPALLADLDRFQDNVAVEAWAEPLWHRAYRFWGRNAVLLWLLLAYVLVKFLLFFLSSR